MNIQEQLNSLIRGNPLSVDTYLREVCKNEHISDTKASMHIYMLKLDGNNRPRTCDFCDYLINRIVDYCKEFLMTVQLDLFFQVQCRRILTLYIECFQQRESAKKLSLK